MAPRLPRGSQLLAAWLVLALVVSSRRWPYEAFRAQRSHRRAAEQVLADYAHLAATRLVERLELRFGAYTCAALAGLAVSVDGTAAGPDVDPKEVHPPGARGREALRRHRRDPTRAPWGKSPAPASTSPDDATFAALLAPRASDHSADAPEWGAILRGERCFAYRLFRDGAVPASRLGLHVRSGLAGDVLPSDGRGGAAPAALPSPGRRRPALAPLARRDRGRLRARFPRRGIAGG